MKRIALIMFVLMLAFHCQAHHIIGGEMLYTYLGKGSAPNTSKYRITLKIFRDQNSPANTAPMPTEVFIGIYSNDDGQEYGSTYPYYVVPKSSESVVKVNSFPPCINNAPDLNYHVGTYLLTVDLPDNNRGYTAAFQTCCRVDNLSNVMNIGGSETGSTFSCSIPPPEYKDNSPEFATSIDVICGGKPFTLQFDAVDIDGDSLVYSFTSAYDGGIFRDAANGNPAPPAYGTVNYTNGYSGAFPLGAQAFIDSRTGLVSGIAPGTGKYVLAVKVLSYRNGVLINDHRKDFILNVTNCDFAGAKLNPKPVVCDSFNVAFANDDTSPLNHTFYWEFGDPVTGLSDTSTLSNPLHMYSDTGEYIYKLVVNRGEQCSDSTIQTVKVYPGFFPAFNSDGECINSSINFTDKTTTKWGLVSSWSWNFGDPSTLADTSNLKNPSYIYTNASDYPVQLTVTSTKGCVKSILDTIPIKVQPDFSISNDTLICNIDTLRLGSAGTGAVSWTPNYNISSLTSFSPLVSPDVSTTYYATLVQSRGCIATDSVRVNVVTTVTLDPGRDTTICLTDTLILRTVSDALHYIWTPPASILSDTAKAPSVVPVENTTYHVVASIGKCNTSGNVRVKVVPYPKAGAGKDTSICFPKSYQLHATGGSIYAWSPPNFLNNPGIADPVSTPGESIQYTVEVRDVLGCPKPGFDTVTVQVEKIVADAGPRDTSIVVGQPLQLNGTGADFYLWSPPTDLNNPQIANPVAMLSDSIQYVLRVTSISGCFDLDTIRVIVYKVKPDLYVPSAFTPNGDGKNDIFKPILIGMKSLRSFKVYNRLGQLVYSTTRQGQGWDGTFKGIGQDMGIFVWTAEGEDYLGKFISRKGSVTLIR